MGVFSSIKKFFKGFAGIINAGATIINIDKNLTSLQEDVKTLKKDTEAIKTGLQSEILETLTRLYEKVMEQNYASQQDRDSANKHYRDIHALGKDGFAENMWNTIVQHPYSSKRQYLAAQHKDSNN